MTKYQKRIQNTLAKAGDCPVCKGLGILNHPPGPVKIGAKPPVCTACSGSTKDSHFPTLEQG